MKKIVQEIGTAVVFIGGAAGLGAAVEHYMLAPERWLPSVASIENCKAAIAELALSDTVSLDAPKIPQPCRSAFVFTKTPTQLPDSKGGTHISYTYHLPAAQAFEQEQLKDRADTIARYQPLAKGFPAVSALIGAIGYGIGLSNEYRQNHPRSSRKKRQSSKLANPQTS